jgi:hypothetical protein
MESEKLTIGIPPKESKLKGMLTKPKPRAPIMTLFGTGGVGKTTLLSLFPNPVLIRTEDGSQAIDGKNVYMFEQANGYDDIVEQLEVLLNEDHKLKTVAIDSITKMHLLFEAEVLASDPRAPSINQALGGYGAGNKAIAKKHAYIRQLCGLLNERKGMTVIFIAHAELDTVEPPDSPSYSMYSMKIQKGSMAYYTDDVDLVAHVKLKTFTKKTEDKTVQAISNGDRVLACTSSANSIAKNRYGITEEIPYTLDHIAQGINPLMPFIPYYNIKE